MAKDNTTIDIFAHVGYFLLMLPALYWLGALLYFFGVKQIVGWYDTIPHFALLMIIVFIPTLTLLLGGFAYLRNPKEKRKLAYQSLMTLSVICLLLFLILMIDGSLM
jgi:hypothetical protein